MLKIEEIYFTSLPFMVSNVDFPLASNSWATMSRLTVSMMSDSLTMESVGDPILLFPLTCGNDFRDGYQSILLVIKGRGKMSYMSDETL